MLGQRRRGRGDRGHRRASRSAAAASPGCARRRRGRGGPRRSPAAHVPQRNSSSCTRAHAAAGSTWTSGSWRATASTSVTGRSGATVAAWAGRPRPPAWTQARRRGRPRCTRSGPVAGCGACDGARPGGGRRRSRCPLARRRRRGSAPGAWRGAGGRRPRPPWRRVRVRRPWSAAGRLDRGGVPAVVASHDRGGSSRRCGTRPSGRPADQSPEDGFRSKPRRAQPVDGTVAGDQGGGAGVTEKAVVLDRCRRPPPQRLVGAHRRHLSRP